MIWFSLYMLFTVSYFLHLTSRLPSLGALRFELILGLALLIGLVVSGSINRAWAARLDVSHRLAWFLGFIILSLPLVTWPGSVIRFNLENYTKAIYFFIMTAALVNSEKRLKVFVFVFVGCQLFRIIEPLYLHLTMGYWGDAATSHVGGEMISLNRLAGAPHDIVNSNQLAWVIVSILPFVYYLAMMSQKALLVTLSIPLFLTMVYTLTLTGSRSGMVCFATVILSIGWLGPGRAKRLALMSIFLMPTLIFAATKMDTDMLTRYKSLFDHSVTGGDTAQGRIDGILENLKTVSDNPLFGHGLGTSGETNFNLHGGRGQTTHNLYIETLQETGLIGFVLFILYVKSIGETLFRIYKEATDAYSPFLRQVVQATIVWVIMDVIYSFSCFGLSSWEWYLFGGITHTCAVLAQTNIATTNS